MRATLEVTTSPDESDRRAIIDGLIAYNQSKVGKHDFAELCIRLRDEDGKVVGGLFGRYFADWLFVELLFVPEELRRQDLGTALMGKAEAFAREKGCVGVWLDTFSFQAPGFYKKLGYSVFGEIKDYPPGASRYFLQKRLDRK